MIIRALRFRLPNAIFVGAGEVDRYRLEERSLHHRLCARAASEP
jgi:hypothetical protein